MSDHTFQINPGAQAVTTQTILSGSPYQATLEMYYRGDLGWSAHLIPSQGSKLPFVGVGDSQRSSVINLTTNPDTTPWAPFLNGIALTMARKKRVLDDNIQQAFDGIEDLLTPPTS